MKRKYEKYLSDFKELTDVSGELSEKYSSALDGVILDVFAPSVYMYAEWIVSQAVSRGIRKLYFLARDGYSILRAAEVICRKRSVRLECDYFYCSRHSLRLAAYRFKDGAAYDRFFGGCFKLSAYNLLKRADFNYDERCRVYDDIGFDADREKDILNKSAYYRLCDDLRKSEAFNALLMKISDAAYENTVGYIRQEEMDRFEHIGIADIGWTGSIQHSLKRILEADGINCRVTGFYFGMLETPPHKEDSIYVPMLFGGDSECSVKAWFSQNVMECVCTAPHGMTEGYRREGDRYIPVLKDNENDSDIIEHISDIIYDYAVKVQDFEYDAVKVRKAVKGLMRSLMLYPDSNEAAVFECFSFCDDSGGEYREPLVNSVSAADLRESLLHPKLYWFYGSAAVSDVRFRSVYRLIYFLVGYLRYFLKKFR